MNNINTISFTSRPRVYKSLSKEVLEDSINKGMTVSQIAKEHNRTYGTVLRDLHKYGIETNFAKLKEKRIQQILFMKEQLNYSIEQIACKVVASKDYVRKVISTYSSQSDTNEGDLLNTTLEKLNISFDTVKKFLK